MESSLARFSINGPPNPNFDAASTQSDSPSTASTSQPRRPLREAREPLGPSPPRRLDYAQVSRTQLLSGDELLLTLCCSHLESALSLPVTVVSLNLLPLYYSMVHSHFCLSLRAGAKPPSPPHSVFLVQQRPAFQLHSRSPRRYPRVKRARALSPAGARRSARQRRRLRRLLFANAEMCAFASYLFARH